MTITVTTPVERLRAALAIASNVIQKRPAIPILSHALISVENGRAWLTATDLDTELTLELPGSASGDGAFTLNMEAAAVALAADLAETATLVAYGPDDAEVSLTVGPVTIRPPGYPARDLPRITCAGTLSLDLPSEWLLDALDATAHAISTHETRYYRNGVYLHPAEGRLRVVATDGHRILYHDVEDVEGSDLPTCIVPRRAVAVLREMLRETSGVVTLRHAPEWLGVEVRGGPWTLRTKCIDGTYPNYQRVFDVVKGTDMPCVIDVDRPLILGALASAVASGERSRPVRFGPSASGGLIVYSALDNEDRVPGLAGATPEVARWYGPPMPDSAGVQARYLRELCHALPRGFTLRASATDHAAPILIEAHGAGGAIMPMRV